jgi:lysophospholipase L1-like esterase
MRADSVHLNADGYRKLAANAAGGLRELGYLRH